MKVNEIPKELAYGGLDDTLRGAYNAGFITGFHYLMEEQADYIRRLQDFIKNIHDNYDCDSDQHKYHNGVGCRCCDAKKLLGAWKEDV